MVTSSETVYVFRAGGKLSPLRWCLKSLSFRTDLPWNVHSASSLEGRVEGRELRVSGEVCVWCGVRSPAYVRAAVNARAVPGERAWSHAHVIAID